MIPTSELLSLGFTPVWRIGVYGKGVEGTDLRIIYDMGELAIEILTDSIYRVYSFLPLEATIENIKELYKCLSGNEIDHE